MSASPSNIYRIENFLIPEDVRKILDFAEQQQEMNETIVPERAILQFLPNTEITELVQSYQSNVEAIIRYSFGREVTDMSGTTLRKWYSGEFQAPHADCEATFYWDSNSWEMSTINNFSSIFIEYAALTYLNSDYEGGEIYFPDYEIEIKPSAGELIFFPGTEHYLHGVKPILSGHRYAMMTFFTTPKLQYLWRRFVLDESPLNFVDYTQRESMETQKVFNRSNIPETMTIFGQRFSKEQNKKTNNSEKPFGN